MDGEDYGDFGVDKDVLLGSRYYAKNSVRSEARFAILLDMVGDAMPQLRQEGYSLTGAAGSSSGSGRPPSGLGIRRRS